MSAQERRHAETTLLGSPPPRAQGSVSVVKAEGAVSLRTGAIHRT